VNKVLPGAKFSVLSRRRPKKKVPDVKFSILSKARPIKFSLLRDAQ